MHASTDLKKKSLKRVWGKVLLRVQPGTVLSKMKDPISVEIMHLKKFPAWRRGQQEEGVRGCLFGNSKGNMWIAMG